jgi:hypothetical protein
MIYFARLTLYILLVFTIVSCIPEETPVEPHEPGDNEVGSTDIYSIYEYQVYYSLSENKVIKTNEYDIWDFNFDCGEDLYILLNSAKIMKTIDLGEIDFDSIGEEDIPEADSSIWMVDMPSGSLDSTAIGEWWTKEGGEIKSKNHVYLVDRGSIMSRKKRYAKIQILKFDQNIYTIKYQIIKTGDPVRTIDVPKDPTLQYISLSIDGEGEVMKLQPPRGTWDLVFTNYSELLWNSEFFQLYGVKACLINSQFVKAAKADSTAMDEVLGKRVSFEEFSLADAREFDLKEDMNVIGHDWKSADISQSEVVYTVDPTVIFVIQDLKGVLYKMHFLRYDSDKGLGKRGYPGFEFKRF